ncbi:MAG: FAD-dependent oxidoreductase [Candidatus Kapaibacterium sp.]
MITELELAISLESPDDPATLRTLAAARLDLPEERISAVRVRRRSLDARHHPVKVLLKADVYHDEPAPEEDTPRAEYPPVTGNHRVVIVGAGPAGMFAALRLIELGIRPVLLERGKDVRARRRDLVAIQRQGTVNPDSNYCFGEGGAGTYSDGKLYTRATKRGNVEGVLRTLVAHGAQPEILIDAHPHIGSNRLPKVVAAMRESILNAGGEIHFETRVVDLLIHDGIIRGVVTAAGDEVTGDAVILATGHSARDIFHLLYKRGVLIEAKAFAMGVRIEHPQPLIDSIQYHNPIRDPRLPAASYRLASTVRERGVFSFCMCPGGFIVPSATEQDEVVVNGMSLSRRDSPFANSGLVVSVETEDLAPYAEHGPLAGMYYQKSLEVMAATAGGGEQRAPAQRVPDFIANRTSGTLPPCSYNPGITAAPLHDLLPIPLARRLQGGLKNFGRTMHGYVTAEAVIVGVETRTSSPVRVPRDTATLEHPRIGRLYPCGEGAGYAGGIVSAAIDGVRVAEAFAAIHAR